MIDLPEVLRLVTDAWPRRFARGRIVHLHENAITIADGSTVHLRVMIQTLTPTERLYHSTQKTDDDILDPRD